MGEVFSSWVMIEEVVVQAVDAVVEARLPPVAVVAVADVVAGWGINSSAPLARLLQFPLPGYSLSKVYRFFIRSGCGCGWTVSCLIW